MIYNETATSKALNLGEFLQGVGSFLRNTDLIKACTVSKFWQKNLQPLLYDSIQVYYPDSYISAAYKPNKAKEDSRLPSIEIFNANAGRIRSLVITNKPGDDIIEYYHIRGCTNLERFEWRDWRGDESCNEQQWDSMIDFLKENGSRIKHISIQYKQPDVLRFWKVVTLDLSSTLRSLELGFGVTDEKDVPWAYMACKDLMELTFSCSNFPDCLLSDYLDPTARAEKLLETLRNENSPSDSESITRLESSIASRRNTVDDYYLFPITKYLKLSLWEGNNDARLSILKQCPKLERFNFFDEYEGDEIANDLEYKALSTPATWPNLNSMELVGSGATEDTLKDFLKAWNARYFDELDDNPSIESKMLLKSLQTSAYMGPSCWEILYDRGHYKTLERIELTSIKVGSLDILIILATCPHLKSITAPVIHAADIEKTKNHPWACADLEKFDINIETDLERWETEFQENSMPTTEQMEEATIEQLGRLHQLQSLLVCWPRYAYISKGIRLTLGKGLERLSHLKKVERVAVADRIVASRDLEWMKKTWVDLEYVKGRNDKIDHDNCYR
ncbi:hypothetical protein BGX27_006306 [Mortierella sp. AM989]|nr:hypothetical protein BGX27_006306 [Mortierella sp. AM989]